MAKKEIESDFKVEYSAYYRLINKKRNSIWGGNGEETKCHFHTPDEIKMLMEIEKKNPEWRVEKHYYPSPVRI